ncbi:flavodoxin domain-containing protein [Nocardia gipuzkoensis]|uniref:flavodoxin domain-containing protein n=1 Tax=Nocardia gipuzkoensis TaxID=2749991 RepID=UPI001E289DFA|nr:flavodoxin domain-containing protein [Nocardia gipuzkoensis]UGT67812.1 flavodoxin domain-containing protein [Nocardia gipuzkoensis]
MDKDKHRIAVVYATEQGSTRDIAEFISAELSGRDTIVQLADIEHAPELSNFDTLVLGSAVHNMRLLPPLTDYAHAHHDELAKKDVWLFSVGLAPALRGPIGRRLGRIVPKKIAALRDSINAHDYRAFAGRYDSDGISLRTRILYRLLGKGRYGDLRDWATVRSWTDTIARSLRLPPARSTTITS